MRFGDLRGEMDDMSSSTLSIRLAELEGAGLVHREMFAEIPPRVEYTLTEGGKELRKRLFSLSKFAARRRGR
jgi:DNA-binding HxlR family transcriptional regulator